MSVGDSEPLPIDRSHVALLSEYLAERPKQLKRSMACLRTEREALAHCRANAIAVGKTQTQSKDHHQSSKALVACVSRIASAVCASLAVSVEINPQKRCVWCYQHKLHVTARNLDGAVPGLVNPVVVWEVKEYWGKTSGGSKMSDAVYECNLVGRELREFQERSGLAVKHIVFLDGIEQWNKRKSDLNRFLDLTNQGLIDYLFVGTEVESSWELTLRDILTRKS
jgi:hypothetical protein